MFEAVLAAGFPPVEIEPVHYFAAGLYARQITIPAGTMLTGKIHRSEHLCIVGGSEGDISVWSDEHGMRRLKAPFTFVASPGTQRVAYAHRTTIWTTIHAVDRQAAERRDLEAVERLLIVPHDNPLLLHHLGARNTKCLS